MSAWRHAGISCDDCGELFCCHYESVRRIPHEPRNHRSNPMTTRRRRQRLIKRPAVYQRYGPWCFRCGVDDVALDIAHVIDHALGGLDNLANVRPLCRNCHSICPTFWPGDEDVALVWFEGGDDADRVFWERAERVVRLHRLLFPMKWADVEAAAERGDPPNPEVFCTMVRMDLRGADSYEIQQRLAAVTEEWS